jgi:WbqC-like protein
MRLAIMQPYFFPYAGYFRLFGAVDLFMVYDDVQFSYPSYVHRNKLTANNSKKEWLTIPLKNTPLSTKIRDLEFADGIKEKWPKRMAKFSLWRYENFLTAAAQTVPLWVSPCRFIVSSLSLTRDILNISCPVVISSELNIRPDLRGPERVLAICQHLGATEYVNASGGTKLYDREGFKERGIELKFLTHYENKESILERICKENPEYIRAEIDRETRFQ